MTNLHDVLAGHVSNGSVPGVVSLVARGDRVEVCAIGSADVEGTAPMARETIFRIASMTKPITAAAAMILVDDGTIALDDPIATWLPELASPSVVRTPESPVEDVVPAARPITATDLLDFRAGYGFPADFSLPVVRLLLSDLMKQGSPAPSQVPPPDEWMATLARIPLLRQPGEAWLYNTCSDILGVLIARASGSSLPDFLAERIFEPLGMADTGFDVPAAKLDRFTSYYQRTEEGGLKLTDAPDGQWSRLPAFPSGAGGLVSTADDALAFNRMLLADGGGLLSPESVRQMTTNQLTESQRAEGEVFLEGKGWGFGGSVDVEAIEPWNVPGRYGWVGGTGTASHIIPSTGEVTILLSQVSMTGPAAPVLMRDFWRHAR